MSLPCLRCRASARLLRAEVVPTLAPRWLSTIPPPPPGAKRPSRPARPAQAGRDRRPTTGQLDKMLDQLLRPETQVREQPMGQRPAQERTRGQYKGGQAGQRREGAADEERGYGLGRQGSGGSRQSRQQGGWKTAGNRGRQGDEAIGSSDRGAFGTARQGGQERTRERTDGKSPREARDSQTRRPVRQPTAASPAAAAPVFSEDAPVELPADEATPDRHRPDARHRKKSERGSLLHPSSAVGSADARYPKKKAHATHVEPTKETIVKRPRKAKQEEAVQREVFIPPTVRVGDLARIVDVRLGRLQNRMRNVGMTEDQLHSDHLLSAEDASLVAMEFGLNPIVDEERSFDIYPDPIPADTSSLPLRPPVVTIMGHVDHGKTTLLDSLRHTAVAAGEAGGITQHIGAFSVSLASMLPSAPQTDATITFLDTPGHAAFTAMRARGASVTDIVVLVVAADDGVMPQTKEVLELVKAEGDKVGLVVAINKCDKPGINVEKVKSALGAEGIFLEEDGGDTPSVRVSGLQRTGLDTLVETLSTVAEVRDLRAATDAKAEGYVLESRVEKGRGNVATVLVARGTLKTGSSIVAGTTWCRVRQMTDDKGAIVTSATPGMPVIVTGWKDVPLAGDEMLEAVNGEDEAKRAITNRKRDAERKALMRDVEKINEKRRLERERLEKEKLAAEAVTAEGGDPVAAQLAADRAAEAYERANAFKELRLVIKADVSGTVEAVVGSLEGIGNKEAGVKIIHTGVGDVQEADVALAEASEGMVIGFNVKAARSVQNQANSSNVPLQLESVIYRLIESVRAKVAALLPPIIETRVLGEATVQQVFNISLKGRETQAIAGCRVGNGTIARDNKIRILRGDNRELVFDGTLDSLKQGKKDITDIRKGSECGLSLAGFQDYKEGDIIVAYANVERPREL